MPSEPLNSEGEMIVARSRFDGGRSEILLGHPQLRYPIALMKISASEYSACLMRCSHQACETSVSASEIVCPCHGSRFSRSGDLLKGPATEDLTRYPVRLEGDTLYISGL